jgi:hypothetical protein
MMSLSDLNTFSAANVTYTANVVTIDRSVGNVFQHVPVAWNTVRTFGALTGNGITLTFAANTATTVNFTFPSSAFATHTLSITTAANTAVVSGILDILDYNAARAQVNPTVGEAGNVTYTVTTINTNNLAGNIAVDYRGVPV